MCRGDFSSLALAQSCAGAAHVTPRADRIERRVFIFIKPESTRNDAWRRQMGTFFKAAPRVKAKPTAGCAVRVAIAVTFCESAPSEMARDWLVVSRTMPKL